MEVRKFGLSSEWEANDVFGDELLLPDENM